VVTEHNYLNQLYNIDETGLVLDGHVPRLIAKKSLIQEQWEHKLADGDCLCKW